MGKKKKKQATKKAAKRATAKPTKKKTKRATKKTAKQAVEPELTWIVWEDAGGIWLGSKEEFRRFKGPDTILCDVLDTGTHREFDALHRAVQLGQGLRQTYANCVRQHGQENLKGHWLQFDDAAQERRIREWEEQLRKIRS
jgi:hypothetical protein